VSQPILFISGMFRSGTTLLGRMLNAHPEISVASDPYLDFFKHLRSAVGEELGIKVNPSEPIDDYYFLSPQRELFQRIRTSTLDRPFNPQLIPQLMDTINTRASTYCPLICDHLSTNVGKGDKTFEDVFNSLLTVLTNAYGKKSAKYIGFKEVWANEFIPAFAHSYENARFIQILRDPRAVSASKNAKDACYPWLFLGRQWRKITATSWLNQHDDKFGAKVLTIKYEDLVSKPVETSKNICNFLELDFSKEMADASSFVDGGGRPWKQNSNYVAGGASFDSGAIDRWRSIMTERERALIDFLCHPEMTLFDYVPQVTPDLDEDLLISPPVMSKDRLAGWVQGMSNQSPLAAAIEMRHESLRYDLLHLSGDKFDRLNRELVSGCFLDDKIATEVRK